MESLEDCFFVCDKTEFFLRMGPQAVGGMENASNSINEPTDQVKDDEIYAAMNAVLFSVNHIEPSTKLETAAVTNTCDNPMISTTAENDDQRYRLQQEPETKSSEPDTGGSATNEPTNNLKSRKPKKSKALKNREELDRCLEEQREKRKKEKLLNNTNELTAKKGKKNRRDLLKVPEQCFDCGKVFAYTGYLEIHMRYVRPRMLNITEF